jgi:hypothetical protein
VNLRNFVGELKRRKVYNVASPAVALVTPALLRVDPTWDPLRGDPLVFIRVHNEPLPVAAMRVGNEDRSPAKIHG